MVLCDRCVFYHPLRKKICSIIPRAGEAAIPNCACRLEVPETALGMRTTTDEERRTGQQGEHGANTDEEENHDGREQPEKEDGQRAAEVSPEQADERHL